MTEIVVGIRITADGGDLVGAFRVGKKELDKFKRSAAGAGKAGSEAGRGIDKAGRASRKTARETARLNTEIKGLGRGYTALKRVVLAAVAAFGIREIIRTSDAYKLVEGRLRTVVAGSEDLAEVQARLFEISQETRVSFIATAELYARIARSSEQLGKSQEDLLRVTDLVNKTLIVSGASTQEASAGTIQFGQALAAGALRGDELRSVMEQMPRLAKAIADGMGITIGQLRILGEEGKLTGKKIVDALLSQGKVINNEFAKIPVTVGQAVIRVGNSMGRLIEELEKATGAGRSLAGGLSDVAKGMDDFTRRLKDPKELVEFKNTIAGIGVSLGDIVGGLKEVGSEMGKLGSNSTFLSFFNTLTGNVADTVKLAFKALQIVGAASRARRASQQDVVGIASVPPPVGGAGAGKKSGRDILAELRIEVAERERLAIARDKGADALAREIVQIKIEQTLRKAKISTLSAAGQEIARHVTRINELRAAEKKAIETAKKDIAARKEIRAALIRMGTAYERAVAGAVQWRKEALEGLDEAKAGYEDMAATVDRVFNGMIKKAQEQALRDSREWAAGASRAFSDYAREAGDAAANTEDLIRGTIDSLEDMFARGEISGKNFFDALEQAARRFAFRMTLSPLFNLAGGFFKRLVGGLFPGAGSGNDAASEVQHRGGIAGAGGAPKRRVPASTFAGARRYHRGNIVGPGEVPVIARRGEGIFTPRQMDNAGQLISAIAGMNARQAPVSVEIIDQRGAGAPQAEVSQQRSSDGTRSIRVMIKAEVNRGFGEGSFDNALRTNFGISRQVTLR